MVLFKIDQQRQLQPSQIKVQDGTTIRVAHTQNRKATLVLRLGAPTADHPPLLHEAHLQ